MISASITLTGPYVIQLSRLGEGPMAFTNLRFKGDSMISINFPDYAEANLDFVERLGEACLQHVARHREVEPPMLELKEEPDASTE